MKHIFKYIFIVAGAACWSCQQNTKPSPYINTDKTAYTFSSAGGSISVKVDANVDWSVETDGETWFSYERQDDRVMISAGENDGKERTASLRFVAEEETVPAVLTLKQLGSEFSGSLSFQPSNLLVRYSPKGIYELHVYTISMEGLPTYQMYHINTETKDTVRLTGLEDKARGANSVPAISDGGHILFVTYDAVSVYQNGSETVLTIPAGYESYTMNSISSDGTIVVGTARKSESPRPYIPFKIVDGIFEELPLPENNAIGEPLTQGATMGGISADGSVIWGYDNDMMNYSSLDGIIYWKNGEIHYIGQEAAEVKTFTINERERKIVSLIRKQGVHSTYSGTGPKISSNGKWLLAEYYDAYEDAGQLKEVYYPVLIDTETGKYTIFKEQTDMCGFTVDNEGIIFGATPYYSAGCVAEYGSAMTPDGNVVSVDSYFKNRYGIVLSNTMMINQTIPEKKFFKGQQLTSIDSYYGIGIYQVFTLIAE